MPLAAQLATVVYPAVFHRVESETMELLESEPQLLNMPLEAQLLAMFSLALDPTPTRLAPTEVMNYLAQESELAELVLLMDKEQPPTIRQVEPLELLLEDQTLIRHLA